MRHYKDGDTIYIEPWRADAFPVIKDLVVDRTAFDDVIEELRSRCGFEPETFDDGNPLIYL